MNDSIHDYDKRIRCVLERIRNNESFSERDKEIIIEFKEDCLSNGMSKGRALKYIYLLKRIRIFLGKNFEDASTEDIKKLVIRIENSQLSEYTKLELKIIMKRLYKFIRGTKNYPPEVKWIIPGRIKLSRIKLPEELLTEEDIKKLIIAANNARDKAFLSMLYETGCRIGEILFIRIKHIQFDKYGAVVIVSGKTGSRRLRLITSVPYLTEWLNEHTNKDNPGSYLWPSKIGTVMKYASIQKMIMIAGKKAGITKRLNPHNFRHSRATDLANHLTEAQMKVYFGWTRTSDMTAVYVHLSGRDVDNAILKAHGITDTQEKGEPRLQPKTCLRCETVNQATNKFCKKCGMVLDKKDMMKIVQMDMERKEADKIMDDMLKDEEFRSVFMKKARELMRQSGR